MTIEPDSLAARQIELAVACEHWYAAEGMFGAHYRAMLDAIEAVREHPDFRPVGSDRGGS